MSIGARIRFIEKQTIRQAARLKRQAGDVLMLSVNWNILRITGVVLLVFGSQRVLGQVQGEDKDNCEATYSCIGMVIDSGDPVLIQMGQEMSKLVTDKHAGTIVKPTAGPIANVGRLLSTENAALSVVPSDMLQYTARSEDPKLRKAKDYLRFIMTIGQKVVHVVVRKDITRLEDLNGRRVVMGPDNTASWVVSNNILRLHGVTPSERLQLKPPDGISALLTDQADAAFLIGDAPMQALGAMRQNAEIRSKVEQVHMLELKFALKHTGYQSVIVSYPGIAENLETVAILPTLVVYDFAHKSTPYFRRRCIELARIGEKIRSRLEELRASGHKQWNATRWEIEAGDWQRDSCFFGTATQQVANTSTHIPAVLLKERAGVLEAQRLLKELGYDVGPADGIMRPQTAAELKRFQADRGMTPDGKINSELLTQLRTQGTQPMSSTPQTVSPPDFLRDHRGR
jgi:uncharacterized protein